MREDGCRIGSVNISCYRPFPLAALRAVLQNARRVVALEKSLAPGIGGMLSADIRTALAGTAVSLHTAIAGLGGRAITKQSLRRLFESAHSGGMEELVFLDLNTELIQRHLEWEREHKKGSPPAANALSDIRILAPQIG
jgi:pyruvate ferredoxin oxidoreductase alpha subunit